MTNQQIKLMNQEIDKFMAHADGFEKVARKLHDFTQEKKPDSAKIPWEKENKFRFLVNIEKAVEV